MAPEVLVIKTNPPYKQAYNPFPADMWALGICLFILMTRHYPFAMSNNEQVLNNGLDSMRKCEYTFPSNLKIPQGAKDLINALLQPDIQLRATMRDVFKNPWLNRPLRKLFGATSSDKIAAAKSTLYGR